MHLFRTCVNVVEI